VMRMCHEAGLRAEREPSTCSLLEGSTWDEKACRSLFPKVVTKATQESILRMRELIEAPLPNDEKEKKNRAAQIEAIQNTITQVSGNVGRRVDIAIRSDEEEMMVDTTVTHTTNKTNLPKSTKHAHDILTHLLTKPAGASKPSSTSPAVTKRAAAKRDTYATLMAILMKLHREGKRHLKPLFVPAVMTTHGEMGPDLVKLLEWITGHYRRKVESEGPRADGQDAADLTTAFRQRSRERLLVAIAKGTAAALRAAGLSKMACHKYQ
jgi:hypothetical protein